MIISLYAGILALIYIGLSGYVIKGRFKNQVSLGDNNIPDMQKRVRVHRYINRTSRWHDADIYRDNDCGNLQHSDLFVLRGS